MKKVADSAKWVVAGIMALVVIFAVVGYTLQ